jgi:ligand-binding sensor domain-containing protein
VKALGWFLMLAGSLWGARLPVRTFSVADGMPRDVAFCVVPDSRGFLWICTNEGLSWFDGYRFRNYGVEQGLAHRAVTNVLETSGGTLLVGSDGGLDRLGAAGFERVASDAPSPYRVSDLVRDRNGVVWGAGFNGIFHLDHPDDPSARLGFIRIAQGKDMEVTSLAADPDGTLWIGTGKGLAGRRADGSIDWPAGLPADGVKTLLLDRQNRLWVGTLNGLWRLETRSMRVDRQFGEIDGL